MDMDNSEAEFIKERVLIKKEQLTREGLTMPEDKELISEAIQEEIDKSLKNYPPDVEIRKVASISSAPQEINEEQIEIQSKVKELVEIALTQNIPKAVTTALKTNNAHLIDKLHDTLVDKYYQTLKNQKVI